MKRRDVLRSVVGIGAALSFEGCSHPADPGTLTDADVERMAAGVAGIAMKPGQVAGVREVLVTKRFTGKVDPTVQPSLAFDPEVDVE